jgi:5-methylthioadenosine/S-adenosylhomocysteine deaminase
MLPTYSLSGMTLVTPHRVISGGSLKVEKGRLKKLGATAKYDIAFPEGTLCFPALVNAHDHMRGDYLPRIGPQDGSYYLNWSFWERDLRGSPVLEERARISVEDMYQLAAYKNLFSGVVTVNDHFPHEYNEPFIGFLPVRVISEYALAHECSSFDLRWGDGMEVEHRRAVRKGWPFITHLEEGFDQESQAGVEILARARCLDRQDLFIHCIGFDQQDIRRVSRAGASVAWCPASNMFMFNVTCKIREMLRQGVNVCLGTDSTHTGSVNLLAELRFARATYRRLYGEELPARTLLEMVTANAARALCMQDRTGELAENKYADLLLLRSDAVDPYEALLQARHDEILLLLQEGTPIYGDASYEELFRLRECSYTRVSVQGRQMCVRGDPAGLLQRVRQAVGFRKVLDYLPLDG